MLLAAASLFVSVQLSCFCDSRSLRYADKVSELYEG